ncbi:hypothetical protein DACRYDRAFT_106434 [Dacryopinax primogenitus]|uniref:P-loop containing nucleoside triphosphate hydrolase protein n=1 Tax=Dacryopinax primogenitus (strain DJM 731) TaxID=1858805 RepID=M5G3L8_DACPD|nr:uncharacterized protein DACRYDRAFT_106434 [Dacryopinax primogenitus]EJU03269.1 hypothetical protein DACRYDRAFT_106434 [Dacryopinax primogenitus]
MSELDALERLLARVSQSGMGSMHAFDSGDGCSAKSIWLDPRFIPAYASALLLLLFSNRSRKPQPAPLSLSEPESSLLNRANEFVKLRGGWVIYVFNVARVFGASALVGLTIAAVVLSSGQRPEVVSGTDAQFPLGGGQRWDRMWDCTGRAEVALLVAYAYATLLSLLALVLTGAARASCSFHASWILFIQFLVFFWRNFLPLTTFTGIPADNTLPWLLWTRGSFVALVGLAIPALVPRMYVPFDPSNPAPKPAPEQTASIFSFMFFLFLEPIVFTAWRVPQLPYDRLPPLPDTDWSDNLRARAMDKLDPVRRRDMGKRERHIFFGLMDVFRWEYTRMSFFLVLEVMCRFLGPIGINRLLTYMEHDGEGATMRPWVWILFMFLAPTLNTLAFNLYIFTSTRMTVQAENVLTQIIFEHALRVRLTDESIISASPAPTPGTSTPGAPEDGAETPAAHAPSASGTETATLVDTERDAEEGSSTPPSAPPAAPASTNGTDKGKDKDPGKDKPDAAAPSAPPNTATHLSAKINNIFGTDIGNLIDGRDFLFMILDCPFEVILCIWFLWVILSWAAVVGMLFIIITLPIPGMIASRIQDAQRKMMQKTDLRVQAITESLGIIRMIKMFGWESLVRGQVGTVRDEELYYVRLRKILGMLNNIISGMLPMITMIITYAFYTLVLGKELDAARVFSSVPVFDTLRHDMAGAIMMLTNIIKAKVSLDRVSDFLRSSRLLDRYRPKTAETALVVAPAAETDVVGFHNATFTWTDPADGSLKPGQRNFRLHIQDLVFKSGEINVIVGPTGCGKTSILMALLGEMHFEPQGVDSWFSLPRGRGLAYAAQESWVQNDTIRANILFGNPYDEVRYKKVLYQCGLEPDLTMFNAGDAAEVGERGLTLSGGQKARITLARAVYSPAQTLLLDDVVSALDVHTARWVVDKCLQGDLIKNRTVILVTHAVALIAPIATNVISLSTHGRILSQGPLAATLTSDAALREELKESKDAMNVIEALPGDEQKPADKSSDGKLIIKEEMAEGRIKWASVKLFTDAFGGPVYWILLTLGYVIILSLDIGGTWWLGRWSAAYESPSSGVNVIYYLTVFILVIIFQECTWLIMQLVHALVSIKACRRIHNALMDSVLASTLRWIDSTPVGRIVSRFTQDVREIDGSLTGLAQVILQQSVSLIMKFIVIMVISPIFSIPGALIIVAGLTLGQIYIAAQMCVKRLRSNWRSPLYNHFNAAVSGLISVRAYGAEESFKAELRQRADAYSRPSRTFYNLNRWINTRADLLGAAFSSGLATYLLYVRARIGASTTGFSLTMAIEFSSMILWWVRVVNMVEISANSLERIRDYLVIDHEPEITEKGKPPAYWPSSGSLQVEDLSARYSKDGPLVLQNITFEIKSGERVGIVGRTGSGKSSLALSLLRLIPTEGKVYYDGQLTEGLNLDALRNNLAIIPQEPTLISGTLRFNLDPFSQHDDAVLNYALRAIGLLTENGAADGTNLTLDSTVANAGSNFSVGQRQLIALARASLRGTKVLILDEATASVDAESDSVIQTSIRTELHHATLITIAHRLLTIMDYDKIMVLDAGKLVEFDSPMALLQNEKSYFRSLVEESGDKEKLISVAERGRSSLSA